MVGNVWCVSTQKTNKYKKALGQKHRFNSWAEMNQ